VALLGAPLAALASLMALGAVSDLISSGGVALGIAATVLALVVSPVLTWWTAAKPGWRAAAGPAVTSLVITATLFGAVLLTLVLETSRELSHSA
jgi:hypothetical protein